MKLTLLIVAIFFSQITISQEDKLCEWFKVMQDSDDKSEQLELIKNNFVLIDDFYENENLKKCKVVYIVSVNKLYLLLSSYSAQPVNNPKGILKTLRLSEIDTINVIGNEGAKALYNADGVVYFKSSSKKLEKRIDSIRYSKM